MFIIVPYGNHKLLFALNTSVLACFQMEKVPKILSVEEIITGSSDSVSEPESVRRLDPWQLSFKHIFVAVLILLAAAYLFQRQNRQF